MDRLFLETIEYILVAGYTARDQKVIVMQQASAKLDALKFFLKVTWWANALSTPKYAELSIPVADIGKMLGGWHKQLTSK